MPTGPVFFIDVSRVCQVPQLSGDIREHGSYGRPAVLNVLDRSRRRLIYRFMRLLSLDIRNFRVIKEAHLAFPDSVIGIIGPNGAGKSSIVESIAWALYGMQAARSGRDEVKSTLARPADTCEVGLTFQINGDPYRIVRRLVGKTERGEVELYRGERSESVGTSETRDYVTELLGLDWRGFLTSFLARQQELNALSDLQPAKRREHLAGMLGIERLDKALQAVKEDTRVYREKGEFIQRRLLEKEQVAARIEEIREHVAKLNREHDVRSGACKAAEGRFAEIQRRFEKEREKKDRCSVLAATMEAERKSSGILTGQLKSLEGERTKLDGDRAQLEELKLTLVGLEDVRTEIEKLKVVRSRAEYRAQLVQRKGSIDVELKRLSEQLGKLETESTDLGKKVSAIPEDVVTVHESAEHELEKAREEYTSANARKESLVNERRKAREQVEQVASIGPETVCDRCHRPFGEDLPDIKQHLDGELAQLDQSVVAAETRVTEIRKRGEALRTRVNDLAKEVRMRGELVLKVESLGRELDGLKEQRDRLSGEAGEIDAKLKEAGDAVFDEMRFVELSKRLSELETVREKVQQLSGGLARLPVVQTAIKETLEKIEVAGSELAKHEAELKGIGFDEQIFSELSGEFKASKEKLEAENNLLMKLTNELDVMTRELEVKQEQLAGFKQAEEELESCVSGQYYGEKLSGLFAEFRKHLIASIRPRLAELSSTLFSDMTDGKYSLVDLDRDYNLQIMDYGQMFGINRYSGGEKDLANLCLRLAISLALTESAGLDRSFVILDEVFGSQDEGRRELIFHGLAKLRERFPQIFLITHIDEIKDKVETLIQVSPTGSSWSEVRINGEVA